MLYYDQAQGLPNMLIFSPYHVRACLHPTQACFVSREAGLSRNALTMLETPLSASLRRLDLADNQLGQLQGAFSACTALEHLSLAHNRITNLAGMLQPPLHPNDRQSYTLLQSTDHALHHC